MDRFQAQFNWITKTPQLHAMPTLRYGENSTVSLELAHAAQPLQCGTPRGVVIEDLSAAVEAALRDPLEYPPLARCTTSADQIVLALGHGVPGAAEITAAVIRQLVEAGVQPDGITVLRPDGGDRLSEPTAEDLCRLVPEPIRSRIPLFIHDPTDRQQLAFLATGESGEPVLLNRAIHHADLVLPIGCLRDASSAGYYGILDAIFPTFSDQKTMQRFRSPASLEAHRKHKKSLVHEVDHVGWLLGITFTIQVVPAVGDSILHVLAGQTEPVRQRGEELFRQAWSDSLPARTSLVVAGIEGCARKQTWHDFGRAVESAMALVEDGGAIAVCCDLAEAPGPAIQRLLGGRSRDSALRKIRKERPTDALPAAQLARALDHGSVYLLSRLDPSLVEDLEMIPVAKPEELVRLAQQHGSGTLLSNAALASVSVDEDL